MSDMSDDNDLSSRTTEKWLNDILDNRKPKKRNKSTFCLTPDCGVKLPPERYEYGYCVECAAEEELRDRIRGYK